MNDNTTPTLTMRVYGIRENLLHSEWGVVCFTRLVYMDINQLIMYDDKSVPKILYLATQ